MKQTQPAKAQGDRASDKIRDQGMGAFKWLVNPVQGRRALRLPEVHASGYLDEK